MTIDTLIIVNGIAMLLLVVGFHAFVWLAHRALASPPTRSDSWGLDEQGVPSGPLPLEGLLAHERELARAA